MGNSGSLALFFITEEIPLGGFRVQHQRSPIDVIFQKVPRPHARRSGRLKQVKRQWRPDPCFLRSQVPAAMWGMGLPFSEVLGLREGAGLLPHSGAYVLNLCTSGIYTCFTSQGI